MGYVWACKVEDFWLLWSIVFLIHAIGLYTQIGVLLRGGQLEGRPVHYPNSLAVATMSFHFMMHIVFQTMLAYL